MWFTLFVIVACVIGIPIGILILLVALLILLPIHIGGSGYFRENDYALEGWAKAFAGLIGVVFEFSETKSQLQVVFGKRVVWQPKEELKDAQAESASDPIHFEPPVTPRSASNGSDTQPTVSDLPKEEQAESVGQASAIASRPHRKTDDEPSIDVVDSSKKEAAPPHSDDEQVQHNAPSKWARVKLLWADFLRYRAYWKEAQPILFRFVKRFLRILSFRYFDVQAVYGFADPAQTGRVFGYAEAIRPMLGKRTQLVLIPDFTQTRIEGAGKIEISFHLSRLFWAILVLGVRGGILGGKIWWRERQVKRSRILNEA